tara:strand:- start:100 stop:708 length:609 start_codon:yes stop_codon:yes gene_type:complete
MDNDPEENASGPRIDVRNLPESVSHLWEAMLRQNPSWDLSKWLDERASEELELLQSHLGRERLRTEQRLHRIENLSKQMKRRSERSRFAHIRDPNQKNLFDVYSLSDNEKPKVSGDEIETEPLIDLGNLSTDDDPLLAYVSQKILMAIEDSNILEEGLHLDDILRLLQSPVITSDDIDESISWLLQRRMIVEIERDVFIVDE